MEQLWKDSSIKIQSSSTSFLKRRIAEINWLFVENVGLSATWLPSANFELFSGRQPRSSVTGSLIISFGPKAKPIIH